MKIEVNIKKSYFFAILSALFVIILILGVYAFSPLGTFGKTKTQAIVFGHSADEVVVNIGGTDYTLQDAINQGKFAGAAAVGSLGCTGGGAPIGSVTGCGCSQTPVCPTGYLWNSTSQGTACSYGTAIQYCCTSNPNICSGAEGNACGYGRETARTITYPTGYYPAGQCVKQ